MKKEVVQQQQELVVLGHGCVTTKAEQVLNPSGVQHPEVPITTGWNKEKTQKQSFVKYNTNRLDQAMS